MSHEPLALTGSDSAKKNYQYVRVEEISYYFFNPMKIYDWYGTRML
jgi:hypothetical protein